ncbi:hypothetical protein C8Q79DRAFT_1003269 [Trametes meyenii]|nr:hypothetical protein C8Q79DRAFT_1003269 [Trametes meyenii]
MSMLKSVALLSLAVSSAYGHAFINAVQGANGVSGLGLGVTFNGEVARGGTTEQPFQLDTPVMKNQKDDPCGATLIAGSVKIPEAIAAVSKVMGGLPTIPANGEITMGIFQVNADGGGPFTAEINTDATGKTWEAIQVLTQPPGVNGIVHNAPANSTITVQVPNNLKCTGANGACLIRFNNGGPDTGSLANGAGPFGGCVAVAQANGAASTGTGSTGTGAATGAKGTKATGAKGSSNAAAGAGAKGASNAAAGAGAKGSNNAATGAGRGANRQANAMADEHRVFSRHFYPTVKAREEAIAELEKRQKLTAQLIDELKTSTGTAIDIPIDRLAGHDDDALLGGNSTTPKGATLTTQQAVDLKKAVALAIEQALDLMASDEIDAGKNGQDSAITDKANADAALALKEGKATSINAGNAGVGFFQTEVVDSLLGGLRTASADLTAAAATATAAGGNNAAQATSTAAATGKGRGTGRGGRFGQNRQAAAAAPTGTANHKMMKRRM